MSLGTLLLSLVVAAAPRSAADKAAPLPRGLSKTAQVVVAAYRGGDVFRAWHELAPLVPKLSDEQIEALDGALAAEQVPSVGQLLVDARLALVQQDLSSALPEPQIKERLLTLRALAERIDGWLQESDRHPLLSGKEPSARSMIDFERQLWELHVLRNKLLSAARAAQYAGDLAGGVTERQKEQLTPAELELLSTAGKPASDVRRAAERLAELEAKTRFARLDYGLKVLEDPTLPAERFMAAYSTLHDAEVLQSFLKERSGAGSAPLSDEALANALSAKSAEARSLAGQLAPKAKSFFEGLHWWLRGRYGRGTDLGGLAKSEAALHTPGGLVWLYMPAQPPVPEAVDEEQTEVLPPFDRRHHYIWAWEDRRIIATSQGNQLTTQVGQQAVDHKLSSFW
ncbi:MAG: hypothetical protein KY476_12175 [Planctomycetes bacterium]|nr:hypothetical protein [Planctomycetota bacterium]